MLVLNGRVWRLKARVHVQKGIVFNLWMECTYFMDESVHDNVTKWDNFELVFLCMQCSCYFAVAVMISVLHLSYSGSLTQSEKPKKNLVFPFEEWHFRVA